VSSGGTLASGQNTPAIRVNWGNTAVNNVAISAIAVNTFGCTQRGASSIAVTINQRLKPQTPAPLSGLTQLCLNQATDTYNTVVSPNSRYTWRFLLNTLTDTLVGSNTVTKRWPQTGTVKIWVNEIASPPPPAGVCFGQSDTLLVRINRSPDTTLAITGQAALCQTGSGQFSLAGYADSRYKWVISPAGTSDTLPLAVQGNSTITAVFAQAGSYRVNVFETTNIGCPGKLQEASLLVNPKPTPTNLPSTTFVCANTSTALFRVAAGLQGSSFTWLPAGGTVSAGQGTSSVTIGQAGTTLTSLRVVERTAEGCNSDTLGVPFVRDNSAPEILSVSVREEDDSKVLIRVRITGNTSQITPASLRRATSFGTFAALTTVPVAADGQIIELEDASPLPTAENVNQYQLTLTNRCGADTLSVLHKTVVLQATADDAAQASTLNWTPSVGFAALSGYSLFYQLEGQGSFVPLRDVPEVPAGTTTTRTNTGGDAFKQAYRVKAVAPNGEVSFSNIARATFTNTLGSYNIVTPDNKEGGNDTFTFKNLNLYPANTLKVFNRWGRQVHEASNYRGDYAPDQAGVYMYLFTAGGTTRKGWFEVVK